MSHKLVIAAALIIATWFAGPGFAADDDRYVEARLAALLISHKHRFDSRDLPCSLREIRVDRHIERRIGRQPVFQIEAHVLRNLGRTVLCPRRLPAHEAIGLHLQVPASSEPAQTAKGAVA